MEREDSSHQQRLREEREGMGGDAQRFSWQLQERGLQRQRRWKTTEPPMSPDFRRRESQSEGPTGVGIY
jgi:hypothetical protein